MEVSDSRGAKFNVKDSGTTTDDLVRTLLKHGMARLVHFGRFRVIEMKGRKRYDFKKREMVPVGARKMITFAPSKGLREMLNKK